MSADGIWNCTINSPMGAQEAKMTLMSEGAVLSGKMEGAQGTQEFEGGTIDGDNLAWTMDMTSPMPMTLEVSATVEGDNLNGTVKLGNFGDATFAGTRE